VWEKEQTMHRCKKCKGLMEKSIKAEHTEDLGGVVVKVLNAVQVYRCGSCDSEIVAIPDMDGLVRSVAIARALNPVRLAGPEVKYLRRVLDMTQVDFAKAMDLTGETVSRWENDARGIGGTCEKLVRHNVCAPIYKEARGRPYDASVIANMEFRTLKKGKSLPPIEMVRVRVPDNDDRESEWGQLAA
jgi:DNA-binding transcriptional regulator YiaG